MPTPRDFRIDQIKSIKKEAKSALELQQLAIERLEKISDSKFSILAEFGGLSQKARGYFLNTFPIVGTGYREDWLGNSAYPWSFPILEPKVKYFARPCPMTPRHGFVESREIRTYADFLEVYKETIAEDPEGEVIIAKKLNGRFSAVATNAGVSFGLSNDGATSGKSVLIPAPVDKNKWNSSVWIPANVRKEIGLNDTMYIELVEHKGNMILVQRRNGPEQTAQTNYIPKEMLVKRIITPEEVNHILLEWEKLIKNTDQEGTVVYLAGQTLSSHYSVHAIEHDMAVVTDHCPTIGFTLSPTPTRKRLTKTDYEYISRHMSRILAHVKLNKIDIDGQKAITATSVATFHAQSLWDNQPHLLKLRAWGLLSMARLLYAACKGEIRYWKSAGPGRYKEKAKTKFSTTRYNNYRMALAENSLGDIIQDLENIEADFDTDGWRGSFGGRNWAQVANYTKKYVEALARFIETPTATNWKKLIMAANIALNTAHNTGKALNKFIESHWLSVLANAPGYGFCNAFAGAVVIDSIHTWKRIHIQ